MYCIVVQGYIIPELILVTAPSSIWTTEKLAVLGIYCNISSIMLHLFLQHLLQRKNCQRNHLSDGWKQCSPNMIFRAKFSKSPLFYRDFVESQIFRPILAADLFQTVWKIRISHVSMQYMRTPTIWGKILQLLITWLWPLAALYWYHRIIWAGSEGFPYWVRVIITIGSISPVIINQSRSINCIITLLMIKNLQMSDELCQIPSNISYIAMNRS
jgi:hypothetical protein